MIVMKFGGTSVQDAIAMQRVLSIVQEHHSKKLLIVSSACSGITGALLDIASTSVHLNDLDREHQISHIIAVHLELCSALDLDRSVHDGIKSIGNELQNRCEGIALLGECTDLSKDAVVACGELFSTQILAGLIQKTMNAAWFDARLIMKTDSRYGKAKVDMQQTEQESQKSLGSLFTKHDIIVTQGFIASNEHGVTTTLGRGGSDYSAALFGAAMNAEEIIIWTDVSGIASADPRLIPHARFLQSMSFEEARSLSFFGAKVLHPETILPALSKGIPVHVRNTFKPFDVGTTITKDGNPAINGFRSVIAKKPVTCLTFQPIVGQELHDSTGTISALSRVVGSEPMVTILVESVLTLIFDAPLDNINQVASSMNQAWHITMREGALISAIGSFGFHQSGEYMEAFRKAIYNREQSPLILNGYHPNVLLAFVSLEQADDIIISLHEFCA